MNETLALLLVGVAFAALGGLLAHLIARARIAALTAEREAAGERLSAMETSFAALSAQALRSNNEAFLQLAQETLKQFHVRASGDLAQKEKAVENLVRPIKEALEKTERQLREIENARKEAYGALGKQLEQVAQTQSQLQGETRNLVQALRRPEVRGQWGELTLKRLIELAGMVEYCDFVVQEQIDAEGARLRPDLVIRLPDAREIVVDAKTPLDAYLSAVEAASDEARRAHLEQHARTVRARVRELAGKSYWAQFANAPDYVVMFIPGEQFLSAAMDADRDLLEDALRQKVILATPTSLVALLRAVAYGWRQQAVAANAERIREVGEDLYRRINTFAEHLTRLGRALEQGVSAYNQAVGSFDAKLLPGARKFTELGISAAKIIETPEPVDKGVRKGTRES